MRSFLGVPILIRGTAWGNLYLTQKRIGEFTEADEYAAMTLATWAAIAVDHSRLLVGVAGGVGEPAASQPADGHYGANQYGAGESAPGESAAGQAADDARSHIDALYRAGVIQTSERDEIARRLS